MSPLLLGVNPVDTIPAMILPALVLIALALFLPSVGARESRRRQAWARFDALARIRGLSGPNRESLAAWATVCCEESPHLVLCRRKDFDRYVRSEVTRLAGPGGDPEARRQQLARLAALRAQLGFGPGPGRPHSSHDLRQGETLTLLGDDGTRQDVRVLEVDEEGITWRALRRTVRPVPGRSLWVTFQREGEGSYRFRAAVLPHGRDRIGHGEFLLHEDRRREPRLPLVLPPFWVAVERLPDGAAPEDPEGVEVEVLDVSLGGLALLADREVRRGSEISLDLPLGAGLRVPDLMARVVGQGYREGGGPRAHFLSCQFNGLEAEQRQVLETFIEARLGE